MISELTDAQRTRIERALAAVPFAQLLGIRLQNVGFGRAVLAMEVTDKLKQNDGIVHGGAIASLIDSATAFAILPLLGEGERTTTIDLTINFLRPLSSGSATATATLLRAGRRIISVSAEVHNDEGKLVASALSTYLRLEAANLA
ncbi:MAG: PaaI family thioesterase [Pyrinomonadaceae bacterium]